MEEQTEERTLLCGLCGQAAVEASMDRICRLNVCGLCSHGELSERVLHRGWSTSCEVDTAREHYQYRSGRERSLMLDVDAACTFERDLGVDLRLKPEGFIDKLAKLKRAEVQAGDPLFDDLIFVKTKTPEKVKRLLAMAGAQEAAMEIFSEGMETKRARIIVEQETLKVRAVVDDAMRGHWVQLHMLIFAHYLESVADVQEAAGAPYR